MMSLEDMQRTARQLISRTMAIIDDDVWVSLLIRDNPQTFHTILVKGLSTIERLMVRIHA